MIVLDTHSLVWWVNGDSQLSKRARLAVEHERKAENGLILISAISAWEIVMLIEKERLTLTMSVA